MAGLSDNPPLLGPSGRPLAPETPQAQTPADDQADSGTGTEGTSPAAPRYRISSVFRVDPRLMPATLVTLLTHDPFAAYRERLEAARQPFDRSRDLLVATAEAQFRSQGVPESEARVAGARVIEWRFMASIWDAAYASVLGSQVAILYAAAPGGPNQMASTLLAANHEAPTVWVTTRAQPIGDRLGAWALPVSQDQQMPASVVLELANFRPLRLNFAKVKV